MPTIQISFHQDPVIVADLCADLKTHGVVYWHTTRPNFQIVSEQIDAAGVHAIPLCARPDGDFLNFLVRTDLADNLSEMEAGVAKAISQWGHLVSPFHIYEPYEFLKEIKAMTLDGFIEECKSDADRFKVSGWPCHLESDKKAGKHSVHETNRWTLWKRREWRGANTAPNSGPRCFRPAAMPMHPLPR